MKTDYKHIVIPDFLVMMKWIKNEGKCAFDLYRELNISYNHLHYLKHSCIKLGWIYIERVDTRDNIYLTDKGHRIVAIAEILFEEMGFDNKRILHYVERNKHKQKSKGGDQNVR